MVNRFISCDWGTSRLRVRLIDLATLWIEAEVRSDEGVANSHAAWSRTSGIESDRWFFFREILRRQIRRVEGLSGGLAGVPVLISGMASSSIGMRELPYKVLPFSCDGSDLQVERVQAEADFPHAVFMISGARSESDIMRGEETQLVGALHQRDTVAVEELLIFPGTHSKHVVVKGARVVEITTYMTGEFFDLLTERSVLSQSVKQSGSWHQIANQPSFEAGVCEGAASGVLHGAFRVRARSIIDQTGAGSNFHFLSGVLIGAEIASIATHHVKVTIVGEPLRAGSYQRAFEIVRSVRPDIQFVDSSLVTGQWKLARQHGMFGALNVAEAIV